jgi:hypothetical protein
MRHIKRRYRRMMTRRALRPWTPWLQIDATDLEESLSRSGW